MSTIRAGLIASNALQTPITLCSVCEKDFQPLDDFDFVCKDCKNKLVGHCSCRNDDVVMDWGVETGSDLPYFWIIECVCGNEMKSKLHRLDDQGRAAKELFSAWCFQAPNADTTPPV